MNAAQTFLEDQIETNMETIIAKLESDVGHIKDVINDIKLDLRQTQVQIKAANDSIAALQSDVSSIKATLPHLATKADLSTVEGSLSAKINSVEGSLNAKINSVEGSLSAKINSVEGSLSAKINALETKIIQWIVGTVITTTALAFSIAKFVS